jgi:hypothetical protein
MSSASRFLIAILLLTAFLSSALPCGPGYITPLFDTTGAPENPYTDFAGGRLGILKPTFRRSVLFAAYRHIAGTGLSSSEQKSIVDVWNAEIKNQDLVDNSVEIAVKAWVEKRAEVVGDSDKLPAIYIERSYGGYDFFPNCTKSAFETAARTLAARVSSYGKDNTYVKDWLAAQDQVFSNCSSGKQTPAPEPIGSPDWLQKDRAYQLAAASFYSMDYERAKKRFSDIALDTESPWQETADYLVARTLVRQASLTRTAEKNFAFYIEAEDRLRRFVSKNGEFSDSAEGLTALIRYRIHPKERVSELAQNLSFGSSERFKQDLIDYSWLLDKFEAEALTEIEKRKAALKEAATANSANAVVNTSIFVPDANSLPLPSNAANVRSVVGRPASGDGDIKINLWSKDYSRTWEFFVPADATDEMAIAAAEEVVGAPISEEMKERVREGRRSGYAGRFSDGRKTPYEGGYYGEEKLTPSLLPGFLKKDVLTEWLFAFQMKGPEAYLSALEKYRNTASDLWLMTALSKAEASSTQLPRLLDAADNSSRTSAAYTTIAYHQARLLLARGRQAEARKLIDEMISRGDEITISAQNSFLELKLSLVETLDDFLRFSLKRPFAFDFDGSTGTINELIERQKSWFDPETNKEGREAYEAEIEKRFSNDKFLQRRPMFDSGTIEVLNQHFPTAVLMDVMNSPVLPDHMRERFAITIWTRSYLLNDAATMAKVSPALAEYHPEFAPLLNSIKLARTPALKERAALYFVLKNPVLSPYIEDGLGKSDNEFNEWDSNDWWCEPYDMEYDSEKDSEVPKPLPTKPRFLSGPQLTAARRERKRLAEVGSAPEYLAEKVLAWARQHPADKRLPEVIYIMVRANGWTKYGCGNNEEIRNELASLLKKRFPKSEWAAKLAVDESDR